MRVSIGSSVLLILIGLFGFATRTECALAAMSVDLGSQFIKVGLVKPGVPMEIVLNKESRRKTPNVLSIRNGERLFGDPALGLNVRYPKTVYPHLLDLLSKNIDHPSVDVYRKRHPHLVIEKSPNSSSIVVPFRDEVYSIESLLAMILSNLKEFTEAYAEQTVRDIVITVPVYFTQAERLAIEKATQIARLNLLQLINDGTAVALNYGVFRRKEITEKPLRMMIYDMGAMKTTVTLVEYKVVKEKYGKEPKLSVLGVGYDRNLGGLEMTLRLQEHLVKRFRENYKTDKDITTNDRAMGKMLKESERLKQVLSANADHFAQIESVHEDIDMKIRVSRDEFTALILDYEAKISKPVEDALKMAELKLSDIDQVALFGAGTRVPKIQEAIQAAVGGKELGKFLNTDEAAAMGAVFLAAHLSSGFKVKPFNVEDLVIYPIQVKFTVNQQQENGETIQKDLTRQIFQYKTKYPTNKKTIGFTSFLTDFNFELNYGDLSHFNAEQHRLLDPLTGKLATISVDGLTQVIEEKVKAEETEFKGVKVPFILDGSGIVRVGKAEATIQRKSQGVVESITNTISGFFTGNAEEGAPTDTEEKKGEADAAPETPEADPASEAEPSTQEEKKEEQKAEEPSEPENKEKTAEEPEAKVNSTETPAKNETEKAEKKVPEVEKVVLGTQESYLGVHILTSEEIEDYKTRLEAFERTEKLAAERAAAENELESFAFEASLLPDEEDFVKFSTEEEREKLAKEVTRIRAWLEDDTTPETKTGEFKENLTILKDILNPIKKRISESSTLPEAITNLENMLNSSRIMVGMGGDDEKSLFSKNDTEAFAKKLDKLTEWIESKKSAQLEKKPNDDPAVLTSEVALKIKALDRELNRFMKKMKAERTVNVDKSQNKTETGTETDETTKKPEKADEAEEQKPTNEEAEKPEDNKEAKDTEKVEL
ncbi:unnamed protein product [Auanema sp. JU1783]|nr:unnamed protein product [Auanema sp. JU1783]